MKKKLIAALFLSLGMSLSAQTFTQYTTTEQQPWQDPEVNEVNRMAAHADFVNKNEWRMSLHGVWNNGGSDGPRQMPIPGVWELNGYGEPMYAGIKYEWKTWWKSNPPALPDSANYSYTYVRNWAVPKTWKGRDVILHIGSVTSCVEVWCNGKYVGYGEDSKLEQEFDLTRFVRFGKENEIKMLVRRWCDGSYMEDQDFFRYKGFARETYLAARSKHRIEDVKVEALLNDDFSEGTVKLDVKTKGKVKWQAELASIDDGKWVMDNAQPQLSIINCQLSIKHPKLWSAEQPNLYTLHITSNAGDDITIPVGFRRVEIKNAQLLVNGQPVLIKGVNRHELDPDSGYVVSHERMEQEVRLLKSWNVNAVRMSHYPNAPYMYELCDRYGLYVVSETNIETHGMGFKETTLAKNPLFRKAHMERNQRHVASRRNHPCIIIWSMGNECGYGENFEQVYDWLKVEDPTRPIQFEQAYDTQRATDIYCPMYPTYGRMDAYLANSSKTKPMIMCEYAHAMGNSVGELDEYWNRIRQSPKAQGGFIWDMVDQAVRLPDGSYGYDGDWATSITGDHNFCVNGLFQPDLKPNPHAYEVRYYYQNIWTKLSSGAQNTQSGQRPQGIMVFNENFFTDLSDVTLRWQLLRDGVSVKDGSIEGLDVQPQDSAMIELPIGDLTNDAEYLLNVDYFRGDERIAYEQLALQDKNGKWTVENGQLSAVPNPIFVGFDQKTGFINSMTLADGTPLLKPGAQLRPNFWRAPTDNDYGAKLQRKQRAWLDPKMTLTAFEQKGQTTSATYDLPDLQCRLYLIYNMEADGSLSVTQRLVTDSTHRAPDMFRFGMQMQLPHEMENITYYGRGPWENYQNRRAAARLGIYHQTVTEQFHPYVRPQENGTKTDVRWWRLTNDAGRGIEISGLQPLSMSALHYTINQLDDGIDKDKRILPCSHSTTLPEADCTNLCIDLIQQGQACIDSWAACPLDRYMVHTQDMEYSFRITPIVKPEEKDMAGYVMVYHKDADHGLHMAYSWDGYTWTAFNDDKPIMAGDTIAMQKGIRDPYIFRAPDGAFCVAMTDLHVFGKRDGVRTTEWERDGKKYDWGNNRGLVLLRSFDLIHWTRTNLDLTALTCPTGEVDAEGNPLPWSEMGCAWAPEIIATEDGRIMMHFTSRFQRGRNHIRYVYMSDDFTRMTSEPQVLLRATPDAEGRITKNIIDSDITKIGDTYHLFCTEMGHPRHAVSKSLTGPYSFVPFDDGVPQSHEAPMLWKLIGQQKYILMQDRFSMNPHNFYFCETTDLDHFTPLGYFDDGLSPFMRANFSEQKHGAVVQVTKKELNQLIKYWNK